MLPFAARSFASTLCVCVCVYLFWSRRKQFRLWMSQTVILLVGFSVFKIYSFSVSWEVFTLLYCYFSNDDYDLLLCMLPSNLFRQRDWCKNISLCEGKREREREKQRLSKVFSYFVHEINYITSSLIQRRTAANYDGNVASVWIYVFVWVCLVYVCVLMPNERREWNTE